ncbi:probable cytochrome P450 6a14 [Venturia canescens]|uniref:probable cytochrome P450 6a14 n=1 Tax=Venturia canescens TaxID=32260 RepID=UPI001C9BF6F3|nr:probable cytochrome P450 6a14 [Venturia canescens]
MFLSTLELSVIAIGLLSGLYYYLVANYDYWESRHVKGPKPVPFFGTVKNLMFGKYSIGDYCALVYGEWKNEPFSGVYLRRKPVIILHDLDLIKNVLIKDFSKFADRGIKFNEKVEPLAPHLFNLEPKRWRPLRLKLSPTFTSGKLKDMFYLLVECANHLEKYLGSIYDATNAREMIMEVREFTAKFTTDVIGVCAFGLQMNAMAEEDSPFRVMGRRVFSFNWKKFVQFRIRDVSPKLYGIIGPLVVDHELNNFFIDTMKQTMEFRKKNNVVKNDFVDLLMAIKDHPQKIAEIDLTDNLMAAQLFVFFLAGFETSSSTMSNAFYELALNPMVQKKLREEIKSEMDKTGGVIDYESIKSLKYLDMVFQETLRKYPPVTVLMRKSSEPYTFETSSKDKIVSVEKEQTVWIPIYAIQRDPRYFPKPELFDPERFTEEAIKTRHPMAYLPFGDGPRNCVGKRFGVMQTKVGLVKILHHYRVEACEKTCVPYENEPRAFLLAPKNGIYLKIVKDQITDL